MMRIGIAEDQALVRESLAIVLGLESDVEVCWTAATGTDAVRLAEEVQADMILMDLRLPDMDGVMAIRRIRALETGVTLLVLTTIHNDEWLLDALQAGAVACFFKEIPPDLLLQALRQIRADRFDPASWGENWRLYAPEIQFKVRGHQAGGTKKGSEDMLTAREIDVLRKLCVGATNVEIAGALHLTEGTVKNYVSSLYTKLGVRHRAEAIRVAIERGIC